MIQIGRILSVKEGQAYMEVTRKGACGSACATCSSSACESKSEFISIPNELNAREGDTVELYVNDHLVLHSIYKLYGIPLIAFIVCVLLGHFFLPESLGNKDVILFVFGAASLVISYGILKQVDKKNADVVRPKMTKIL